MWKTLQGENRKNTRHIYKYIVYRKIYGIGIIYRCEKTVCWGRENGNWTWLYYSVKIPGEWIIINKSINEDETKTS